MTDVFIYPWAEIKIFSSNYQFECQDFDEKNQKKIN